MAKRTKNATFNQLTKAVDRVTSLLENQLDYSKALTTETTTDHEIVVKLATALRKSADDLEQSEVEYATHELKAMGDAVASIVNNNDQLAKLTALLKAGKLEDVLAKVDDKTNDKSKPEKKDEKPVENKPASTDTNLDKPKAETNTSSLEKKSDKDTASSDSDDAKSATKPNKGFGFGRYDNFSSKF
jgi:hypothetical protein